MGNAVFGEEPNWVNSFLAFCLILLLLLGLLLLWLWLWLLCGWAYDLYVSGKSESLGGSVLGLELDGGAIWVEENFGWERKWSHRIRVGVLAVVVEALREWEWERERERETEWKGRGFRIRRRLHCLKGMLWSERFMSWLGERNESNNHWLVCNCKNYFFEF